MLTLAGLDDVVRSRPFPSFHLVRVKVPFQTSHANALVTARPNIRSLSHWILRFRLLFPPAYISLQVSPYISSLLAYY